MDADDIDIKHILLEQHYVTPEDITKAEAYAQTHHATMVEYLLAEGLITKDLLGQAIAESYQVPYADLNTMVPSQEQIVRIPERIAALYRAVLFRETPTEAIITTDKPAQPELPLVLPALFPHKTVSFAYSLPEDIDALFIHYREPLNTRLEAIIKTHKKIAPEVLEQIIADAIDYRASDIHIEPHEDTIRIRFRVDGVLQETGSFSREYYENILNRIKVQAKLRTDEHVAPQDGSLRYNHNGEMIPIRVSITPTLDGEKVVLRLLSRYLRGLGLNDLGLSSEDNRILTTAASKPFGMILVVGPTGSGKTTTLYAALNAIDRPEVNIMTIEDPVEYKIMTANQIQVDSKINLTFAKGLRSTMRQDPDIILVGEIRDQETAEIAVNAALTGHLLLSTFHANDAATAIPRLLDIGAEPFLVASTLELIIGQRLVRRICENCRYGTTVAQNTLTTMLPNARQYFPEKNYTLYQGKGCKACRNSGYQGRVAVFELIQVTKQMQELILQNPATGAIVALARSQGFQTMFEDGVEKVKNGMTTLEELTRVISPH